MQIIYYFLLHLLVQFTLYWLGSSPWFSPPSHQRTAREQPLILSPSHQRTAREQPLVHSPPHTSEPLGSSPWFTLPSHGRESFIFSVGVNSRHVSPAIYRPHLVIPSDHLMPLLLWMTAINAITCHTFDLSLYSSCYRNRLRQYCLWSRHSMHHILVDVT
jgi:hypothetical protein